MSAPRPRAPQLALTIGACAASIALTGALLRLWPLALAATLVASALLFAVAAYLLDLEDRR